MRRYLNGTHIVNSSHQEEDDAQDVQDEDAGEENQHDDCPGEKKKKDEDNLKASKFKE